MIRSRALAVAAAFLAGAFLGACDVGQVTAFCDRVDCGPHGTCLEKPLGAACECATGFHVEGLSCAKDPGVAPAGCTGVDCGAHGSCVLSGGQPSCRCDSGYHANLLTCAQDSPCLGVDCGTHGSCLAVASTPSCQCDSGYHADQLSCVQNDPCLGIDCGSHGSCLAAAGAPSCSCVPGYHAVQLSCEEDDPCQGVSCGAGAHCALGACACDAGLQGDPKVGCSAREQAVRAKLVQVAEAELGNCEGQVDRPYMDGQPGLWCYDFVAWVYTTANENLPAPLYLPQMRPGSMPAGWRPKAGDLIKYTYQHYAMVKDVSPDGQTVFTVEGNVGSCVTERSTTDASVEYYGTLQDALR